MCIIRRTAIGVGAIGNGFDDLVHGRFAEGKDGIHDLAFAAAEFGQDGMVVETFERYFFNARRNGRQLFLVKTLTSRRAGRFPRHARPLI